MKLERAHIYGFGKWVDYTLDFSTDHLNCVFGHNESGKSTIQNFILFMLFGLPPRKREFYRPKMSGQMGGRLVISDSVHGTYTIERIDEVKNGAARCFLNGKEYDEEWLKKQLKGLTKAIYQSIYSFTALDLIHIKEMKDEDLGDILLGIGLTGANNIYSIEKRLEYKTGELFKPYGKKPLINEQLEKVNQLHIHLKKLHKNESTYRQKQSELTSLKNELKQLQQRLETANKNLYTIKQQHALPLIQNFQLLIKRLGNFPEKIVFPENGSERLQLLKEQLLPFQSEYEILSNSIQKAEKTIRELQEEIVDETLYKNVEEIYQKQQEYVENKKQIERFKQKIDEFDIQMNTILKELNINIDRKQLHKITLPFYIEQNWNELKSNLERLNLEKEQLHNEHNALYKQQNVLKSERTKIENKLLSHGQIEELERKISDYTTQHYMKQINSQSDRQFKSWQSNQKRKKKKMNYILIGSIVSSLFIVGAAYFFNLNLLYHVMVIILLFGVGQWFFGRNSLKEIKQMMAHEQNMKRYATQISTDEKNEAEQLLSFQEKLNEKLSSIKEQLKLINIQQMKWNEKNNLIRQQEQRLHKQIKEQLDHYSFLKNIEVKYWPKLFHSLKDLLRLNDERQQCMNHYKQLKEKQLTIHQFVDKLAKQVNIEQKERSTNELFVGLTQFLQTEKSKKIAIEQNAQTIREHKNRLSEIKVKIDLYEKEISKLLSIAEVNTEEDFYQKEKLLLEKQAIETEINKTKEQLIAIFPEDGWKKFIDRNMTQTDINLLEQKEKRKIKDLEYQIERVRQQLADLNADILKMESSESYSKTMHQFYMEKEQLKKLSIDWAVLKVAKEMLDQTKKSYREKYLTRVIDKTSLYFNHITGGAYRKVYAPENNEPFQVESQFGLLYNINELSRGTIDQLYISLRIAISEIMSNRHHLPFIIDDAFLNFDSIRLKRMVDVLIELSRKQQIILFTCHQPLINQIDIPSKVIHLTDSIRMNE